MLDMSNANTIKGHVTIVSTATGKEWTGEFNDLDYAEGGTDERLNNIFRTFNRVEVGDGERLARMGYELPSLTSGDFIEYAGQWYLCASHGWNKVASRQVLSAVFSGINAQRINPDARPAMFLEMGADNVLVYMHPNGEWVRVPTRGRESRWASRKSALLGVDA